MTQGDDKWDEMSDEEFVADLIAKHGEEAGRAMAKAMNLPTPRVSRNARAGWRVRNKPKYGTGIPMPKYGHTTPQERAELRKLMGEPKEHVKRIYTQRGARGRKCPICSRKLQPRDEVALLAPSWRRVHSECVASALAAALDLEPPPGLGSGTAGGSGSNGTANATVHEGTARRSRGAEPSARGRPPNVRPGHTFSYRQPLGLTRTDARRTRDDRTGEARTGTEPRRLPRSRRNCGTADDRRRHRRHRGGEARPAGGQ